MVQKTAITVILLFINTAFGFTQIKKSDKYVFTNIKTLPVTNVKDQGQTSTCWSFSTLSFLESELLRQGKPEVDLSEMFIVWHTWHSKALKYMRLHGNLTFAGGGAASDVLDVIQNFGIVPESVYNGIKDGENKHIHTEFDMVLKSYVENLAKTENRTLSSVWIEGFEKILDSYLGILPKQFEYNGETYTPQSFAKYLSIDVDDYVMLTSFTHHPFYSRFILEVPDNWSYGYTYNLPIDELMQVINYSLEHYYTLVWATDYTEKGFSYQKGIAVVPDIEAKNDNPLTWQEALSKPCSEVNVNQQLRQEQFENYGTTDDHGMHMVGLAKDESGKIFYYVKNSWGTNNVFNGYMYVSESYVRLKTISVLVNKHALPLVVKQKLKLMN